MVLGGVGFSEAWQGVQGGREEKSPRRDSPVGGPTRPWRTLTRLFLVGLRPRRARLRFTGHRYYIEAKGLGGAREKTQEDP